MAIFSSQVAVTTSATLLVADTIQAEEVHIHATNTIYVGGADVTTSNGLKMDNGDKITFNVHNGSIYAVAATGTATTHVLVIEK